MVALLHAIMLVLAVVITASEAVRQLAVTVVVTHVVKIVATAVQVHVLVVMDVADAMVHALPHWLMKQAHVAIPVMCNVQVIAMIDAKRVVAHGVKELVLALVLPTVEHVVDALVVLVVRMFAVDALDVAVDVPVAQPIVNMVVLEAVREALDVVALVPIPVERIALEDVMDVPDVPVLAHRRARAYALLSALEDVLLRAMVERLIKI